MAWGHVRDVAPPNARRRDDAMGIGVDPRSVEIQSESGIETDSLYKPDWIPPACWTTWDGQFEQLQSAKKPI